jgi:hypothetical protein
MVLTPEFSNTPQGEGLESRHLESRQQQDWILKSLQGGVSPTREDGRRGPNMRLASRNAWPIIKLKVQ